MCRSCREMLFQTKLELSKLHLNLYFTAAGEKALVMPQWPKYDRGDKADSFLNALLLQRKSQMTIPEIHDAHRHGTYEHIDAFLAPLHFPSLTAMGRGYLEGGYTEDEVAEANSALLTYKFPRAGGFPGKFYKAGRPFLVLLLIKAFQEANTAGF
ncbi:hypothetical protein NDU88_007657 [Pleurodeles waltl]|uniref:Uncharacterized protein n=1 Tax=Pleurodeles waltl TaxID=8319 RepID=A0AAV7U0F9_PLEWA|nr:hypothetical protein NDU88_007657 [Pleurodeles waltl]